MRISATVSNRPDGHAATVRTEGSERELAIPPKAEGRGSSVNGGELLFLALATCYANDVYREAKAAGVAIDSVEVHVDGDFGRPGEPARNVVYRAAVTSTEDATRVEELLRHTDTVAEIQNSLRDGVSVRLDSVEIRAPRT